MKLNRLVRQSKGCEGMYSVLKAQIISQKIDEKKMAEDLQMNYVTFSGKIAGKTKFTLDEAIVIQQYIEKFVHENIAIEELFFSD